MPVRFHRLALPALMLGLAACSDSDKDVAAPPPPPVVVVPPPAEDSFGAGFGAAFRAASTAEPRTPADGDIIALTLAEDPRPVG